MLDRMEEWLGRKRPAILGKDGAAAALERGEKTLADILNRANHYDDDSFGEEIVRDDVAVGGALKDGWVVGIGEGRTDEDNLSFYLRMSEGAGTLQQLLTCMLSCRRCQLLNNSCLR